MDYESSLKTQRDYYSTIKFARKEALKEGIKEGVEDCKERFGRNLLVKFGFTDEDAAKAAEVPIERVKKISATLK